MKPIFKTGFLALALFGGAATAHAVDGKVYGGANCYPISFKTPTSTVYNQKTLLGMLSYSGGEMVNKSTAAGDLTVGCPVIRDTVSNTNGLASGSAISHINVKLDQTVTYRFGCVLYSANQYGDSSATYYMAVGEVDGTTTNPQSVKFATMSTTIANGVYFMACIQPSQMHIGGYYIGENSVTSTSQ